MSLGQPSPQLNYLTLFHLCLLFLCSGLVILGSFALAVSLLGFFHSFCGRGCLSVFLFVTFLVTVGELAVVISLFANLDSAVNTLVQHDAQSAANSKSSSKSGRRL